MLNKHTKWIHSLRVKFPFHIMSAIWFLVSVYLTWNLASKWTLSNNQSRATLWVLETCLNVGLLPFMVILITASMSSNTYNKASWWEDWTFEGRKSTLSKSLITHGHCFRLWIVWGGEQTFTFIYHGSPRSIMVLSPVSKNWKQLDQIIPEQANHPISVPCPKRHFQILLNCAKQQFVSCTSNLLKQMYDFQKRTMFHPK